MELDNPERGFFFHVQAGSESCNGLAQTLRDGGVMNQKVRLVYYDVNPGSISPTTISKDFACLRSLGLKVVFSQSYCSSFGCSEGVSIDQLESQFAALKPVLEANKDVIAFARAGAIGGWGEWATWQGGDVPESVKMRVKNALMSAVPKEIMVAFRTPPYIQSLYPSVVNANNAFNGSEQSRMGIENDCFMAGTGDSYTFPGATSDVSPIYTGTPSTQRAYAAAMTEYTPFGFETCDNSSDAKQTGIRNSCYGGTDNAGLAGGIMNEGPRYHVTFGHRAYAEVFPNQWIADGCYPQVVNLMGYRFQLDNITHASTASKGDTVKVAVNLHDVGWARIFSARKLVVTLKNRSTGAEITGTAGDMRLLPSQAKQSSTITTNVNIPSGAVSGTYDVYLSVPDIYSTTASIPAYSVRFANADGNGQSWDGSSARFKTGTAVTVP